MRKSTAFLGAAVLVIFAACSYGGWVVGAPATSFEDADFVRPAAVDEGERAAMYEHCLSRRPQGVSPTRHSFVCGCQKDQLPRELNRAEYLYLLHTSRGDARQAASVRKGFDAAGRSSEELASAGVRGREAVRTTISHCLHSSLTPEDLAVIRRRLEEEGVAPSSGAMGSRAPR